MHSFHFLPEALRHAEFLATTWQNGSEFGLLQRLRKDQNIKSLILAS
jgi:hypothetical protein